MKTFPLITIFICWFAVAHAQQLAPAVKNKTLAKDSVKAKSAKADSSKTTIRTAADLKSGASQDVLASFFKLAYQNLSDGHHFQFTSSLFAIKAKTDTTLWTDTKYKNNVFLRNSTIGFNIGLDSTNKFKSASLSYKYAIINNRDKSVFDFASSGLSLDSALKLTNHLYRRALQKYFNEHPRNHGYDTAVNYIYHHGSRPKLGNVPARFKNILDSIKNITDFEAIKGIKPLDLFDTLKNKYNFLANLMSKTSLWTAGIQVSTNQVNKFSKLDFNTEYQKGITRTNTSMGLELDIKGNLDIYDTTAMTQTYNRNVLSGSAGINWIIYKDKKTQKSYVEFKPALAYNNVLNGTLPGETKSKFTGDGILRFRVTDNLWIPFDVKYDPKVGKFFGFLNITSNFDWLGASKPKSTTPN
ncbi:MAG: hypothetical protein M3O71_29990 [Bacteroidota bacterium]|nr:hypothetical protein [Bacteroidota bacterium]